jgi:hypothetical protein
VGDALASSKRSGKSTGLLLASYAATYALRNIGSAEENRPEEIRRGDRSASGSIPGEAMRLPIQFAALPDFLFRYQA